MFITIKEGFVMDRAKAGLKNCKQDRLPEGISQKWLVLFVCSRIRGNPHMAVSYRRG